ncbi:ROK family transcriptional regulator [Roseibium sediminicola]|uniref:ROK family transcriptional regulator n=1 Tax=Roseibium sediminicola TaxID=2933272 RepID=A0ABT0GNA0_9HYPH|nr:ROK family transcriptional regulator [Roseibium sp. CAU 1639]MCK7610899.1 ROK family transcriptional regulator [Roseibium sp. CAU 1639]
MDRKSTDAQPQANIRKGTNQVAVRSHNERLILQLVREQGALTKAEATRATGLSANAISVLFRSLEEEGLLLRDAPIRGKIGQPSTPLRLNPDAHHYVALKIGRRSLELGVVNFVGELVAKTSISLAFPTPEITLDFVQKELNGVLRSAKKSRQSISGMAVSCPSELWSWTDELGAPGEKMDAWRDFDLVQELSTLVPWNILVENDGTAACRAELLFGPHADKQNWIYFYVGTFIGGGVVLNGNVYTGSRGNAGGFGPMRVPDQEGGNRLVDHASLVVLERRLAEAGSAPFEIYENADTWDAFEPQVGNWIADAGRNLAHATVSALSVLDFESVVIDGALPAEVKSRLVAEVRDQLENTDLQGVHMPDIEAGVLGTQARTLGAAATLISADYLNA